jgi:hypothetical protein
MKLCTTEVESAKMINSRIPVKRDCKIESEMELQIRLGLHKIQNCTSNWIRRVNRKRRDRLQSFIFIGPCIRQSNLIIVQKEAT